MQWPLPACSKRSGFTLIELLTVITVIAVLLGLLFPAINGVKKSAGQAQARNDLHSLVNATAAYFNEYGHYPLGTKQVDLQWNTVFGDPDGLYSSADLCNTLRAIADNNLNPDNLLNPRKVVYLEGKLAANPTVPRSGIATVSGKGSAGTIKPGCFVDPWGAEYCIFIDGSYRQNVSEHGGLEWFYWGSKPTVETGIAGVCLGPDHSWGNKNNGTFANSDDIATWQ